MDSLDFDLAAARPPRFTIIASHLWPLKAIGKKRGVAVDSRSCISYIHDTSLEASKNHVVGWGCLC